MNQESLRQLLLRLDQRSYKAYQELGDRYLFPGFRLQIDRVQGDPFAAPSQCRVIVPQMLAGFPPETYGSRTREIALRDFLARGFDRALRSHSRCRGSGNSGRIAIAAPGQTILESTAVLINATQLEVRFVVGLPAEGRRIAGAEAIALFCEDLPQVVAQSLSYSALDPQALQQHLETAEDADWLRQQLPLHGLVAFVADGAILPRRSGVDQRPLEAGVIPFSAPASLRLELTCPNRGRITGMGIPQGITLIVGGGYHGKSTLLQALERGVYNHLPGDGREAVVTDAAAVKIRAEEGRRIAGVDISPLIQELPLGRSTSNFWTANASGSTSQAANLLEALEVGARVLLIDEDTAATNLMIRDRRMQALIAKSREPITPLIDKVRLLYADYGVSTILVMGGSGDYFEVADTVIAMTEFRPQEVTAQAKAIARQFPTGRVGEGGQTFGPLRQRIPLPTSFAAAAAPNRVKWKVRDLDSLSLARQDIDLSAVEQLVDPGQLRAIATAILYLQQHGFDGQRSLAEILESLMAQIQAQGWTCLTPFPQGDLVACRRFELAAAINRWPELQIHLPER